MTENTQTQNNQADLKKSQEPETGIAKPNQAGQNQNRAGQEDKTFKSDQGGLEAKRANPDIEAEAEGDDQGEAAEPETTAS
jgi:hypothetical protein